VALALALGAAHVSPASATTVVTADGKVAQPYQSWADGSLMPTPPGIVVVHPDPCPSAPDWAAGCALPDIRAIYLGPGARTPDRFLHELGHIFDHDVMTDPLRAVFAATIHHPSAWAGAPSINLPQEQFAEAYALCALHHTIRGTWYGMYGYTATATPHRAGCAVIVLAAQHHASQRSTAAARQ
jgi:hypothetical protein